MTTDHLMRPVDVMAAALIKSDLIRRYIEYADHIPTMRHEPPERLAQSWAEHILAAESLGRRCYAMEIEPVFVQVAIERFQKYVGEPVGQIAPS